MYIPPSPFGYCPSKEVPQEGVYSECGRRLGYELSHHGVTWVPCSGWRHQADRQRIAKGFLRLLEMHLNGWTEPPYEYWLVQRRVLGTSWTPVSNAHRNRWDALDLLEERRMKYPDQEYRMVRVRTTYALEDA